MLCGCGSTTSTGTGSSSSSTSAEEETTAVDKSTEEEIAELEEFFRRSDPNTAETIVADIDDIMNTYDESTTAGNEKYQFKHLIVTGDIVYIDSPDNFNGIYVWIGDEENVALCEFTDEEEISKLSNLVEGQTVTIEGFFEGGIPLTTLILEDCKLK